MSKKLNLSMKDRAEAISILPKTGNLEKVKRVKSWMAELEMTQAEKDIELSFNQIRDKDEKSKALNDWYREIKEIEISDELYSALKTIIESRNGAEALDVDMSFNLYEQFLEA